MKEKEELLYTNEISSAKKKANKLPKSISFTKVKSINHPKKQFKRKTCKEKLEEEDNIKLKKYLSHSRNNNLNEIYSQMNGCFIAQKPKIDEKNFLEQNGNLKYIEKNSIKKLYDDDCCFSNKNNKFNIEYNEPQCKSCKDKTIKMTVKNNNEINLRIINNCRKKKMNEKYFMNANNNTHHNINCSKNENFSLYLLNDEYKYDETQNNLTTTSKINGKKDVLSGIRYIKSKDLENIIKCISLENLNGKLNKTTFCKTLNNFQYKKPKINNKNTNILYINKVKNHIKSKSNNKATNMKSIFIKNNIIATNRILNNLNLENIDNNASFVDDGKPINGSNDKINSKSNKNMHNTNEINYKEYNNIININNFNNLCNINNGNNSEIRVKCLNTKIKGKNSYENELINHISKNYLYTPKFNEQKNIMTELINDNKNNCKQNNYLNENLNFTNISNKEKSNKIQKKNYSCDIIDNKKRNNINNIKNIKNTTILRKNGLINNDKIKKYSIKDILLETSKSKDENIEISKFKEIHEQNKKNGIINEKINENGDTTLFDESVIVNDSDVYGTLTIKNTIKNNKIPVNNELNNKEINENKDYNDNNKIKENNKNDINIIDTLNNNYRETLTINIAENNNNNERKNNNKIKIEDLLKDKNILQLKLNQQITNINNKKKKILFFKNYYLMTKPGKNYGVRKTNQDMPVTFTYLNGINGFNIFGVLDGHGVNGHHVSKFLSEYLIKEIVNNKEIINLQQLDKIYYNLTKSNYELLINLFLRSDKVLGNLHIDVNFSGTTCILVIQVGRNLICANVGDSRAILVYDSKNDSNLRFTKIVELSHDCKPDLPEEKSRILKMGGTVDQMLDINGIRCGPQRVWAKNRNYPGLAMSRSLGDFQGKKCGIIPYPEIIEYKLDEKSKYMVICSDGVWEFLSNKNVMDIGNEFFLKNDVEGFTKKLVKDSEDLWEKKDVIVDDITAVVVFF